ncbi:DUF1800 domain-containing protein [Nocardioides rubriscoriae]|uniref:DUF1800 domain-containing protein n=1 Tax=Nocardioides rubriscoriae TaxID=642762 RepID=UPI0014796D71|nr:DUF1800 domain-containing protein [Nocardioides rubriscoriae]
MSQSRSRPPVDAAPPRRRGRPASVYRASSPSPLPARERHLVRRFSWGLTPQLAADVRRAGGARAWFEQQLVPARVLDPAGAAVDGWFPSVAQTPQRIFQNQVDDVQGAWEVAVDLSRWTVARRVHGARQLHEVMTDFWSNLLNVTLFHDDAIFWRAHYDRVVRANALTSFEALLRAAVIHPAMGLYLDNASSTKQAPNENLGRELLELHTVGVDGGYAEADVRASARMLTGYRVDLWWPEFRAYYSPADHDTSPVRVLGFRHANDAADGRAATTAYLSYLARHPATAQRLARRLCVKFVSDTPTPAIVKAVAKAYLAHGTAIRPTLRAMVDHPDFGADPLGKVRMPMEDWIASVRSLGIRIQRPTTDESFARSMYWQYSGNGQAPYEWPAPNGYPEFGAAWAGAGRVLTSFGHHQDLAARWWPSEQAAFPSEESLLPPMPATLQTVIDTVSLRMLGQKPGTAICTGIAQVLGIGLARRLTRDDVLVDYWLLRRIQASLLDSPLHLHR